jgi:hypothetical protein
MIISDIIITIIVNFLATVLQVVTDDKAVTDKNDDEDEEMPSDGDDQDGKDDEEDEEDSDDDDEEEDGEVDEEMRRSVKEALGPAAVDSDKEEVMFEILTGSKPACGKT